MNPVKPQPELTNLGIANIAMKMMIHVLFLPGLLLNTALKLLKTRLNTLPNTSKYKMLNTQEGDAN